MDLRLTQNMEIENRLSSLDSEYQKQSFFFNQERNIPGRSMGKLSSDCICALFMPLLSTVWRMYAKNADPQTEGL